MVTTVFDEWKDELDPQGDSMEEVEKDCCRQAWEQGIKLADLEWQSRANDFDKEDTIKLGVGVLDSLRLFEKEWETYIKPPETGCGSSPTKHVESMMTEFWNRALNRLTDRWAASAKQTGQLKALIRQVLEIRVGNAGCGTCGSATACSSKN